MDKNCLITIKTKSRVVSYALDDYRIAIAICNILDNVAEINPDNIPQIRFISKDVDMLDNDDNYMAQSVK